MFVMSLGAMLLLPSVMNLVRDMEAGKIPPKVYHPDEGVFSDFDDLTDPAVEGF